jgi:hypothetical protein
MSDETKSKVSVTPLTAEEATQILMSMELRLTNIENDLEYFILLSQVNSFISSLISGRLTKNVLSSNIVCLPNLSGGNN